MTAVRGRGIAQRIAMFRRQTGTSPTHLAPNSAR